MNEQLKSKWKAELKKDIIELWDKITARYDHFSELNVQTRPYTFLIGRLLNEFPCLEDLKNWLEDFYLDIGQFNFPVQCTSTEKLERNDVLIDGDGRRFLLFKQFGNGFWAVPLNCTSKIILIFPEDVATGIFSPDGKLLSAYCNIEDFKDNFP